VRLALVGGGQPRWVLGPLDVAFDPVDDSAEAADHVEQEVSRAGQRMEVEQTDWDDLTPEIVLKTRFLLLRGLRQRVVVVGPAPVVEQRDQQRRLAGAAAAVQQEDAVRASVVDTWEEVRLRGVDLLMGLDHLGEQRLGRMTGGLLLLGELVVGQNPRFVS
jgi:hypothetical protein